MNDRITSYIANAQTSVAGVSGAALACTFALQSRTGLESSNATMQAIGDRWPMSDGTTGDRKMKGVNMREVIDVGLGVLPTAANVSEMFLVQLHREACKGRSGAFCTNQGGQWEGGILIIGGV
jgi:hypothetical protein